VRRGAGARQRAAAQTQGPRRFGARQDTSGDSVRRRSAARRGRPGGWGTVYPPGSANGLVWGRYHRILRVALLKSVAARMAGWALPKMRRRLGERQIQRSHLVAAVAETIAKARSAKRCVAVLMLRLKPKDRLHLFTQEHIGAQAEQEFVQLAQLLRPA